MRVIAVFALFVLIAPPAPAADPPAAATEGSPGAGEPGKKPDAKPDDKDAKEPTRFSVHGQATTVTQGNFPFHSPYAGLNSLDPKAKLASTATATLFFAGLFP